LKFINIGFALEVIKLDTSRAVGANRDDNEIQDQFEMGRSSILNKLESSLSPILIKKQLKESKNANGPTSFKRVMNQKKESRKSIMMNLAMK
jgi:hypothetical protein